MRSGETVPHISLNIVLFHATAFSVHRPQVVLGLREPLFCQRPPLLQRGGKVAGLIGCEPFLKVRLCPRERDGPPCKREDKRAESQESWHVLEERLLRSRSHAGEVGVFPILCLRPW